MAIDPPAESAGLPPPQRRDLDLEWIRQQLFEQARRRQESTGKIFKVCVDGAPVGTLHAPDKSIHFPLSLDADIIEVYGTDDEGEFLLATHILRHSGDGDVAPSSGAVRLPAREFSFGVSVEPVSRWTRVWGSDPKKAVCDVSWRAVSSLAEEPAAVAMVAAPTGPVSRWYWPYLPAFAATAAIAAMIVLSILLWNATGRHRRAEETAVDSRKTVEESKPRLALRDGSGQDILTQSGQLRLPVPAPGAAASLALDLFTKAVVPQSLGVQHFSKNVSTDLLVRGGTYEDGHPVPLSPFATAVKTTRPTFRWSPVHSAQSYEIFIYLNNPSDTIVRQESIGPASKYTMPDTGPQLQPGCVYTWQVLANVRGLERVSRRDSFWVLDSAKAATVRDLEARLAGSRLALAAVYESYGLYEDAEAQIRALEAENESSKLPGEMLAKLQGLRKQQ